MFCRNCSNRRKISLWLAKDLVKLARALQCQAKVGKPGRVGSIQSYRAANPFGSNVITADLIGNAANKLERVRMIWLYRQDPPITSLGLGKSSRLMILEPLRQHAGGGGINWVIP